MVARVKRYWNQFRMWFGESLCALGIHDYYTTGHYRTNHSQVVHRTCARCGDKTNVEYQDGW